MSGKKTYLYPGGHQRLEGGWIRPVELPARMWHQLEAAYKARLVPAQRTMISDAVSVHAAFIQQDRDAFVSRQDIKETLVGLVEMPATRVLCAFADVDGWTEARIDTELARRGIRYWQTGQHLTAEQVQAAAAAALTTLLAQRDVGGKRPGANTAMFANSICLIWRRLNKVRRKLPDSFVAPLFAIGGIDTRRSRRNEIMQAASKQHAVHIPLRARLLASTHNARPRQSRATTHAFSADPIAEFRASLRRRGLK